MKTILAGPAAARRLESALREHHHFSGDDLVTKTVAGMPVMMTDVLGPDEVLIVDTKDLADIVRRREPVRFGGPTFRTWPFLLSMSVLNTKQPAIWPGHLFGVDWASGWRPTRAQRRRQAKWEAREVVSSRRQGLQPRRWQKVRT